MGPRWTGQYYRAATRVQRRLERWRFIAENWSVHPHKKPGTFASWVAERKIRSQSCTALWVCRTVLCDQRRNTDTIEGTLSPLNMRPCTRKLTRVYLVWNWETKVYFDSCLHFGALFRLLAGSPFISVTARGEEPPVPPPPRPPTPPPPSPHVLFLGPHVWLTSAGILRTCPPSLLLDLILRLTHPVCGNCACAVRLFRLFYR